MKFNVTEIEFDLNDSLSEEYQLTFDDEIALRDDALGVWEADDEDDLIEEITTASGWCIKSIDYEIQLKQYSVDTLLLLSGSPVSSLFLTLGMIVWLPKL